MKKVYIIGTSYNDHLLYVDMYPEEGTNNIINNYEKRLGGIHNIRRVIVSECIPLRTFDANIIVNKNGSRTSIVREIEKEIEFNIDKLNENEWVHIMYLDCLDKINEKTLKRIKDKNCTVSVDFCLSKHTNNFKQKIKKMQKYIDYIIISNIESNSLPNLNANKEVIIHSPEHVFLKNKNTYIYNMYYKHDIKNSLGMGDYFSGLIIENIINGNDIIPSVYNVQHRLSKIVENN